MRKSMLGFLSSRVGVGDSTSGRFTLKGQFLLGTLVLFLLSFSAPLAGQIGRSGITGTVTDATGAVVPGATITVTHEDTNVDQSTVSSGTGAYMLRNLIPGSYTVTVEVSGFQRNVTENVVTEVEKVSALDVALTVGAVTQTVSVTADAAALQLTTQSSTVGQLITSKEISTLPLNGRSWVSLNFLTPGTVTFHGTTAFQSIMASVTPPNVVVNGLRGGNNEYYIDGAPMKQRETQVILVIPALDSLDEFRVQTGNWTAEYGTGAGGVISASTKSGTNKLHGSVYDYLRNDALDARGPFAAKTPLLKRNQFGAGIGGPIIKDRTFFFTSYEGFRQKKETTLTGDYPTAAMRAGDLSNVLTQLVDPITGEDFVNNQIPVDPLAASWLANWIPLPNNSNPVGSGNLVTNEPQPVDYNSFLLRFDHRINDKTSIFGRYMYTRSTGDTPWQIPGFIRPLVNKGYNYALNITRTISPTTVAQFRFSANWSLQDETVDNDLGINMLDELGVVAGAYGFETIQDSLRAPPRIGISGLSDFGSSLFGRPRRWYGNSYYYDLMFFMDRGSHNMKFGGNVNREFFNFPEVINPTGLWTYSGDFTGSGFADFLLQFPRGLFTLPGEFHQDIWNWQPGLWIQDDWKVNRKLTLNLGFRVDIDYRWVTSSGTLGNWNLDTPPTAVAYFSRPNAQGCPTDGCSPLSPNAPGLVSSPKILPSPRVGFAYRVKEKTVVRGGYGVYWQTLNADPILNMSLNPPFVQNFAANYDIANLPTFNRSNPLLGSSDVGIGAFATDFNIEDGYVQQWNLTIEQALGDNLLSIAYIGNKGTNLYGQGRPNQAPPGAGSIQPRRPYTNVGNILWQESSANSSYNALQLKATRRVARGLSMIASYAWGHVIDDSSGSYIESQSDSAQQPRNKPAERSNAEFDVRHALTFSYIYELPFGRGQPYLSGMSGVAEALLGGWQIQGVTTMFSGYHSTTLTIGGYDNLNNGGIDYPDALCDPSLGGGRTNGQKRAEFFNTSCFGPPGGGTLGVPNFIFGNASRHPIEGPGIHNWDLALQKDISIREEVSLRFVAEFFNSFNRANFDPPNTIFNTAQFGQIFGAADGRQIQFGLKLTF